MKYVKNPVIVNAFKLDPRGLNCDGWFWDRVAEGRIITFNFGRSYGSPAMCELINGEESEMVKAGDYIIEDNDGRLYKCSASDFDQEYILLEESSL